MAHTTTPSVPTFPVRSGIYAKWGKPALDRVVAAALLLVLSPAMLVLALLVHARLGSPVLFRQERIGKDGRPFPMLKFRTMQQDRRTGDSAPVASDRRRSHKTLRDPRHTPFGLFLRRHSLDELPQLVNVLRGEMSLVGPRPELPTVVRSYDDWQHARHVIRPGLTGLWQLTERSDEGDMHHFVHLDLHYVQVVSARVDLLLLAATALSLLRISPFGERQLVDLVMPGRAEPAGASPATWALVNDAGRSDKYAS